EYPIGHRRRRKEGIPVLVEKFERNLATRLSAKRAQQIQTICGAQKTLEQTPVPEFMALFVV
ncbi:MAG: 2-methylcitrate dehydratase, partial [Candidatus Macondimonas sp.]